MENNRIIRAFRIISIALKGVACLMGVGLLIWFALSNSMFSKQNSNIDVDNEHYNTAMEYYNSGDYVAAEAEFLIAKKEVSSKKGNKELQIAEINQKLGALYLDMGRYEDSYELLNNAYIIFRDEFGIRHERTIITQGQICRYDIDMGYIERGLQGWSDLYDITDSTKHKLQISQMIAQTNTYYGNHAKAAEWYSTLIPMYQEFYGTNNRNYVLLANDVAFLLMNLGQYKEALTWLDEAENAWATCSGQNKYDSDLALVCLNKAQSLGYLSNYDEALSCAERALSLCEVAQSGETVSTVISCYQFLSDLYVQQGKYEQGEAMLQRALDLAISSYGEHNTVIAQQYVSFYVFYDITGEEELSSQYLAKAIGVYEDTLSSDQPKAARAYSYLCSQMCQNGQYEEALEFGRKATEIVEGLPKEAAPRIADVYAEIAYPFAAAGNSDDALFFAEQSLELGLPYWGEESSNAAYAWCSYGRVLCSSGDYERGIEALQKSADIYVAVNGENHISVARANARIGDAYLSCGDYGDAIPVYSAAKEIFEGLEAINVKELFMARHELAFSQHKNGDFDISLASYQDNLEFIALYERQVDKDSLIATYNNIAAVYEDLGQYEAALEFSEKAYADILERRLDTNDFIKVIERLDRLREIVN